jgi:uncharacterized membrane protein
MECGRFMSQREAMASFSSYADSRSQEQFPSECSEDLDFEHFAKRTISLSAYGRSVALAFFAMALLCTSTMALMVGAWPVVPFAGLELLLLWVAFRWIASHDGDFERIQIEREELRVRRGFRSTQSEFVFHRPWVKLVVKRNGSHLSLALQHRGVVVPIGEDLDQPAREQLLSSLNKWVRRK